MKKYLILKLTDKDLPIPFGDQLALTQLAGKDWSITSRTVGTVKHALLLYKGQVLIEFNVSPIVIFDRDKGMASFNLTPITTRSKYINQELYYPTSKKASILLEEDIIIKDIYYNSEGKVIR